MKKVYVAVAVSILVSVSGLIGVRYWDAVRYSNYDLTNGQEKYLVHCIACHGERGFGDGGLAAQLQVSPDNIYSEVSNPLGLKAELIASVLDGDNGEGGQMPAFKGVLTEQDVNDVLEYIRDMNNGE